MLASASVAEVRVQRKGFGVRLALVIGSDSTMCRAGLNGQTRAVTWQMSVDGT